MIDIENEIYSPIVGILRNRFPGINVTGVLELTPTVFPCASIEEADNYALLSSRDSNSTENHVTVMYEVNVFSNKKDGKKAECKEIFAVIDEYFIGLGFTRTAMTPVYTNNPTMARRSGRYTANVGKDKVIYRR